MDHHIDNLPVVTEEMKEKFHERESYYKETTDFEQAQADEALYRNQMKVILAKTGSLNTEGITFENFKNYIQKVIDDRKLEINVNETENLRKLQNTYDRMDVDHSGALSL